MQHYLKIYALAVCFVSVICIAITNGFAIYDLFSLTSPRLTIDPWQVQYLRSNDSFVNALEAYPFGPRPALPPATEEARNRYEEMSASEITALREQRLQELYADHIARAAQGLLREVIVIFVSAVLFGSHWALSKRIDGSSEPA